MSNTDKRYLIQRTQPAIYLNEAGQPVNGYQVTILLTDYSEGHTLYVPSLDPAIVSKSADALLSQRDALANL